MLIIHTISYVKVINKCVGDLITHDHEGCCFKARAGLDSKLSSRTNHVSFILYMSQSLSADSSDMTVGDASWGVGVSE